MINKHEISNYPIPGSSHSAYLRIKIRIGASFTSLIKGLLLLFRDIPTKEWGISLVEV